MMLRIRFALTCLLLAPAFGVVLNDPALLKKKVYDFVIVGAGAAGNVVANRLTENPDFSVLVIEAGGRNEGVLPTIVPFLAPSIQPQSPITWNFTTTPQKALNDRVLFYSRGKILGGSSSINFMTYTRGSDDEYDRLASITGDSGWSWRNIAKYYLKSERLVPPSDGHDTKGEVDPRVHGHGPIQVSLPGFKSDLDVRVVNASKELGVFNLDIQSGNFVGFGYAQSTIGQSRRSSSATAYLEPVILRRNLDVLIETQVTKLVQTGSTSSGPSFKMVEFAKNASAKRFSVKANNEIILSAGALNTPQILLLSGIGNKTALSRMGIKPVVDLPDVGQHLQDQPLLESYFTVNSNTTWDPIFRNATLAAAGLEEWKTTGQGRFSAGPANSLGFARIPPDSSIFRQFRDPSAGPKSSHVELIFTDGFLETVTPLPATGSFITVNTAVLTPVSRGSVTLESSDPFVFPKIDPAFLTSSFDTFAMVHSVKAAREFLEASAWKGFITGRFGELGDATTDEEILSVIRKKVVTIWHPTSTARMSPKGARWGVVDNELLVKGVSGLRIVDASVLPIIPAAHTVGPVYIIAERASDLIKKTWSK